VPWRGTLKDQLTLTIKKQLWRPGRVQREIWAGKKWS